MCRLQVLFFYIYLRFVCHIVISLSHVLQFFYVVYACLLSHKHYGPIHLITIVGLIMVFTMGMMM